MYEIETPEGIEQFSVQELQEMAAESGYTLEVLLSKNPNLKKVEDTAGKLESQGQGAPVAETPAPEVQAESTDSTLEDGSLELEEISLEEKKSLPYSVRNRISSTNGDFSRGNVNSILKTLNLKKLDVKDFETKKINENYDKEYAIFKENQEDPARMTALREAKIDLLAPRIDKTILKSKLNQALVDVEITSDEMQETKRQEIYGMAIAADKYLSQDLPADIIKAYSKEIDIKRDQLSNKYDLTTQEGFDKANNEYNAFIDNVVQAGWNSNQTAQERNALLLNTLGEVLSLKATNYTRKTELGLGPLDDNYTKGETMEEGLKKGARQIKGSVEKSIAAGILENINNLQDELNNLPINENEVVSFGGTEMPRQGIVSGGKSGTVKEAKKFYENKILELKKDALSKVVNVKEEEKIQQAFRQASLTDGNVTLDDILLLASEQALQLPLAALTYGVGTFAQEFGTSYFDNIDAYIENNKLNPALKEQLKKKEITQEEYDSALNALRTPENILEASEKGGGSFENALAVGIGNSALEYIGASTIAKGIFGKEAAKEGITSLVNDGFKKYVKSKTLQGSVENITKSGFVEFLTESFQTASSQLGKGASVDDPFKYINIEEIKESAVSGGVIGALFPFAAGGSKATFRESINTAKKIAANFNEEHVLNYFDKAAKDIENSTSLDAPVKAERLEALSQVRNANLKIPKNISKEEKTKVIDLLITKEQLSKDTKDKEPSLVIKQLNEIIEIDQKLQKIANLSLNRAEGKKDIARAEKFKEGLTDLNLTIEAAATTEDLVSNLMENHTNDNGKPYTREEAAAKAKNYGFISQKEDGTQTIFINEEVAFDSGVTTTAQHEVLHAILRKYASNAKNLGVELNDFLEETFEKEIENSQYSKSFKEYTKKYNADGIKLRNKFENKEITEEEYNEGAAQLDNALWEETMPLLSEAITNNELSEKSTIWEKLKDIFNKIFNTSNIKGLELNEGKDVYNLVKNYNKIYKSGRGIGTLKTVVSGETKGKLITKEEKATDSEKFSLASDASNRVQKIYDEQGKNGAMEIAEEYKSMASKIAGKYRDRPGFTTYKEDLIDGILMDPTYGVLGLTLNYKPEENKGVPLAAYINKYLASRSITIANQLLGKDEASTFKSDVTEAKDIMATETAEDAVKASEEIAKEKPVKKKILISDKIVFPKELNDEFTKNIEKGITLNIKKFDIAAGKNKTITTFVGDLKKDIADLSEKEIVKFIKSEGLEKFLAENREIFLDNLTTTFLSKHPFFRKGILKRVNGEWVAPTKVSTYKYDWVNEKGDKLKIDRDSASGRGMTSGPELIKRNPKIKEIIRENEYIDYHFQDGAQRGKIKTNALSSLARQIASEKGFEVLYKDLEQQGKLTEGISEKAELLGAMTAENVISKIEGLPVQLLRGISKFNLAVDKANEAAAGKKVREIYENLNYLEKESINNNLSNLISKSYSSGNAAYAFQSVFLNDNTIFNDKKLKEDLIELANLFVEYYNKQQNEKANKNLPAYSSIENFLNYQLQKIGLEDQITTQLGLKKGTLSINSKENREIALGSLAGFADFMQKELNLSKEDAARYAIETLRPGFASGKNSSYLGTNETIYDDFLIPYLGGKGNFNNKISYRKRDGKPDVKITKIFYKEKNISDSDFLGPWQSARDMKSDGGINIEKIDFSKRDDQTTIASNQLDYLIKFSKEAIKNNAINNQTLGVIWASQLGHMTTPLKMSYDLKYFTYIKGDKSSDFTYEHLLPASIMVKAILGNIQKLPGFTDSLIKKIRDNAVVSLTQKSFDKKLTLKKYGIELKDSMPLEHVLGETNDLLRYLNEKVNSIEKNVVVVDLKGTEIITFDSFNSKGKSKLSLAMNTTFNQMLERKKGVLATETISQATAKLTGEKKGKLKLFVPPSADDLLGMLYNFAGSGKQGDADLEFFDNKLLKPLARANFQLNKERQLVKQGYYNLIKANKGITKKLRKESDYKYYTNDAAVRVYMWTKMGYEIPGISAGDKAALIKAVKADPKLLQFAEDLITVPNKTESWLKPEDDWTASTIESDLQDILSKIGRARIFEEYITNANIIFSKDNLNKIEAAYGPALRSALDDMLYRIEKGRARGTGDNKQANAYLNWVRGSVATTMFFNVRSALLQQLSIVNFTNWEDNNIYAQGKFIAGSPKEYAKYWVDIFNSDWMKERRQGLKTDINEAELVARLEGSKNKNKALLAYILEKGFSLTKYGDNIAIATGGAPFLYNREQKYIKEGMTEAKAKEEAFLDFQEIAERTQQSSRQDLLSNQQVSVIGRIFLAFQNTTMQMTRIQKKAALDLINGRGSTKANIARLVYYSAIQNTLFSYLQNALFVSLFSDDEEDDLKIDDKTMRAANTVLDSALRGSGIAGAVVATLKNALIAWMRENDKGYNARSGKVIIELLNLSPAIGIKARKIYGSMESMRYNKKIIDKIGYDNPNHPYYGIAGNLTAAAFNIPLDRIVTKAQNIKAMTQQDAEAWQRTALFLGYNAWNLGLEDPEIEAAKKKSKFKSKIIKPKSSSRKSPRNSRNSGRKSTRN